ncbi:hypothetical protein K7X08_028707 [Anisodus acutangulus]|uniref:Ubiquitin-like domain-containing protein n=1 Tax=Anisodus acutangulus TaxID=402998 RepID=A0A9Q1L2M4_9SOLA|nr:hypothetical protein K7X08_028707 [Anisodus acutangulus]
MGDGSEEIEVIPSWCAPRTLSTSIMCYFSQRNDIEVLGEPFYAKFMQVTGVDRLYKEELRSGMRFSVHSFSACILSVLSSPIQPKKLPPDFVGMCQFATVNQCSTTADDGNNTATNKRKLDDLSGADQSVSSEFLAHSLVKLQRDQISSIVSSSFNEKSSTQIHFFVRLFSGGKTLVIQAYTTDTVEVIHDKIMLITGIPTSYQRLIYRGRQLQLDQTVSGLWHRKGCQLATRRGAQAIFRPGNSSMS